MHYRGWGFDQNNGVNVERCFLKVIPQILDIKKPTRSRFFNKFIKRLIS